MNQMDIFGNIETKLVEKVHTGLNIIDNGQYLFFPDFFSKSESDLLLQKLRTDIEWKQESMNMYVSR
ncbi:MAG: hypothetical protein LC109_12350 [Bacteroidia bacterium]|nr:hypothetical protein [Bacteroidia bacterium]